LTECIEAHSNLLPKYYFSIWHNHAFAYSAKDFCLLTNTFSLFYEPAFAVLRWSDGAGYAPVEGSWEIKQLRPVHRSKGNV
jgi:hypothetical protein